MTWLRCLWALFICRINKWTVIPNRIIKYLEPSTDNKDPSLFSLLHETFQYRWTTSDFSVMESTLLDLEVRWKINGELSVFIHHWWILQMGSICWPRWSEDFQRFVSYCWIFLIWEQCEQVWQSMSWASTNSMTKWKQTDKQNQQGSSFFAAGQTNTNSHTRMLSSFSQ